MSIKLPELVIPQYITLDSDIKKEFLSVPDLPEGIFKPSDKEGENLNIKYQNMHLPIPQVEFLDNGSGSPELSNQGLFHPYEGTQCKLKVTNYTEAMALGLKFGCVINGNNTVIGSDGTITWTEKIPHWGMWHEVSRQLAFIFYTSETTPIQYAERTITIFPEKPNIIEWWDLSGNKNVIASVSSRTFDSTFKDNKNVKKVNIVKMMPNVKTMDYFMMGCSNCTEFTCNADTSSITSLHASWNGCSSLKSFPLIDTSNVTYLYSTWCRCSSLTSFPLINTSKVKYILGDSAGYVFGGVWLGCTSLTSFPLIDTSNVIKITTAWWGCTGLTSFPAINTSNVTRFEYSWLDCTGLTSFPLIDTSKVDSIHSLWYNCRSLTSFPHIDTSNVIYMFDTWRDCRSLTSFPHIDTSNVIDMNGTWSGCYSLPTESCKSGYKGSTYKPFLFDDGTPVPNGNGKDVDCGGS